MDGTAYLVTRPHGYPNVKLTALEGLRYSATPEAETWCHEGDPFEEEEKAVDVETEKLRPGYKVVYVSERGENVKAVVKDFRGTPHLVLDLAGPESSVGLISLEQIRYSREPAPGTWHHAATDGPTLEAKDLVPGAVAAVILGLPDEAAREEAVEFLLSVDVAFGRKVRDALHAGLKEDFYRHLGKTLYLALYPSLPEAVVGFRGKFLDHLKVNDPDLYDAVGRATAAYLNVKEGETWPGTH